MTALGPGGTAQAREEGKATGEAIVNLPKVESAAAQTLKYIDDVLNDKNLANVTGWEANFPTVFPSNVDTEAKVDQLKGRAFLSAFESLKGAGQITEIEGQKATDALARLTNMRQSDSGYRKALEDFRAEVQALVELARRRAASGAPSAPSAAPPPAAADPAAPPSSGGFKILGVR